MKKLTGLAFLLLGFLSARADDFILGGHGILSVPVTDAWVAQNHDAQTGYTISIESKTGANAACRITVIAVQNAAFPDKARTTAEFMQLAQHFVPGSVEKKAVPKEFSLKSGFGLYCSFTDASLVGKPPVKGNFKTISPGMIYLSKDLVLAVTIFADDLSGPEFKQLVDIIQSTEFLTRANAAK
jgi:hypothetical protein